MNRNTACAFTLVELLTTAAILAVVAAAAVPLLSSGDPQKLNVAAEESANALRFALSEAKRTGGYVLVDGKSVAGQLKLFYSNATAQVPPTAGTAVVYDPLTKRAAVLDLRNNAFAGGVTLTPQFRAGAQIRPQLLIGPGLSQLQGFDGAGSNFGVLQPNSNLTLSYGSQSVVVSINELTGLVTLP